ncbi:hypothetical protein [Nocardia abscessus]|uniref:hypothetical protein n=1 Tax=Nocardia abscessus TaxID=120957 RepID=UPI0005B92B8F|nr:hypothetical protein [Nocardia abscessus]MCC3332499.1 hypothetical protein [Nocardia abscessus]
MTRQRRVRCATMCFDNDHRLEVVAEQWRGGAAVIPETTKRTHAETACSSVAGNAFGRPMRAPHGEPDDSRLQAVG